MLLYHFTKDKALKSILKTGIKCHIEPDYGFNNVCLCWFTDKKSIDNDFKGDRFFEKAFGYNMIVVNVPKSRIYESFKPHNYSPFRYYIVKGNFLPSDIVKVVKISGRRVDVFLKPIK